MRQRSFLITLIIILNVIVFFMWNTTSVPIDFMQNNFLVSWTALEEGRYWVLLTSVFSHEALWHIIINMFVLNSFGTLLEQVLGRRIFISFYLIAGLVSSLGHAAVAKFILGSPDLPALGASGAIAGLVLLFAMMFPKEKLLLFGIIPIPALWGALAFIALDLTGLFAQTQGNGLPIGHGAHLGGAITGILFYFLYVRKKRKNVYA